MMKRMMRTTIQSSSFILLPSGDFDSGDRLGEVVGDLALHHVQHRTEVFFQHEAESLVLLPRCPKAPVRCPMFRVGRIELNVRFDYRLKYAHEEPRFE